jgi:predicted permease
MILNNLFPVFGLILLGTLLKKYKLTNEPFLKTADKLIYFIFFPVLLFWKIGGAESNGSIDWKFCQSVLCAIFFVYLLSIVYIRIFKVSDFKAGAFSQSCYRFNTYIGLAVVLNALGEEGIRHFGILIGFIIPVINVLAVSTLIWFSGQSYRLGDRFRITLKALISNPLIVACVCGLLYSELNIPLPVFLDNTLRLASLVALPLALLSIGGVLTFKSLRGNLILSIAASGLKLIVLPLSGYVFLKLFHVTDMPFKVGMIFFTLPTSTAAYVLSSQLLSDTEVASSAIVLSTLLSFFSLSVALFL